MRPPLKQTHTFVTMQVTTPTYFEILQILLDAGYEHVIQSDGTIDLRGLALTRPEGFVFPITTCCEYCKGTGTATIKGVRPEERHPPCMVCEGTSIKSMRQLQITPKDSAEPADT